MKFYFYAGFNDSKKKNDAKLQYKVRCILNEDTVRLILLQKKPVENVIYEGEKRISEEKKIGEGQKISEEQTIGEEKKIGKEQKIGGEKKISDKKKNCNYRKRNIIKCVDVNNTNVIENIPIYAMNSRENVNETSQQENKQQVSTSLCDSFHTWGW